MHSRTYVGVYRHEDERCWRAWIGFAGKHHSVGGRFGHEALAARAYDCAAMMLYGPRAAVNFGARQALAFTQHFANDPGMRALERMKAELDLQDDSAPPGTAAAAPAAEPCDADWGEMASWCAGGGDHWSSADALPAAAAGPPAHPAPLSVADLGPAPMLAVQGAANWWPAGGASTDAGHAAGDLPRRASQCDDSSPFAYSCSNAWYSGAPAGAASCPLAQAAQDGGASWPCGPGAFCDSRQRVASDGGGYGSYYRAGAGAFGHTSQRPASDGDVYGSYCRSGATAPSPASQEVLMQPQDAQPDVWGDLAGLQIRPAAEAYACGPDSSPSGYPDTDYYGSPYDDALDHSHAGAGGADSRGHQQSGAGGWRLEAAEAAAMAAAASEFEEQLLCANEDACMKELQMLRDLFEVDGAAGGGGAEDATPFDGYGSDGFGFDEGNGGGAAAAAELYATWAGREPHRFREVMA